MIIWDWIKNHQGNIIIAIIMLLIGWHGLLFEIGSMFHLEIYGISRFF